MWQIVTYKYNFVCGRMADNLPQFNLIQLYCKSVNVFEITVP